MSIIIGILTVLEVIVCLLLSLLVLMQRPRQEGLGAAFGSGMTDQMFGAQTTNVLQRGTVYFGIAMFVLTFLLAVLTSRMDDHKSSAKLVNSDDLKAKPAATAPAVLPEKAKDDKTAAPAAPAAVEPAKAEDAKPATTTAPAATTPAPAAPATTAPSKTGTGTLNLTTPAPAPTDAKPADAKPAEVKPVEPKPAEAKPPVVPAPDPVPANK